MPNRSISKAGRAPSYVNESDSYSKTIIKIFLAFGCLPLVIVSAKYTQDITFDEWTVLYSVGSFSIPAIKISYDSTVKSTVKRHY